MRKILLVDDSKSYQNIFLKFFADSDFQLFICESGLEALELVKSHYIDFICSGFYLQDMQGVELCKRLRRLTKNAYKPFVLLTSIADQDLLKAALPAGVTEIFHKRDINQLLAYIQRFPFFGTKLEGRILYIEDSKSQRELNQAIMQDHGLTVTAYSCAEQALQDFLTHDYDLVITDIVLDGLLSGLQLVNQIRRQVGSKGDIPIIATTAYDDITRRVELCNMGITEYIIKPIIKEELFVRINQLLQKQQSVLTLAHYDNLTKLPNRTLFALQLEQAITDSKSTQGFYALCHLDLDGFQQVNDEFGRDAGDQLLIDVASRIKSQLKTKDILSRRSGDEFALLIADVQNRTEFEKVLDNLHRKLAEPFLLSGKAVNIGASSGIALFSNGQATMDTLIRHADHAMFQAKQAGRNRFHFFDTASEQALRHQQVQLKIIQKSLAHNEFCLYYQPKVNLINGEVLGMEALIRWNHPTQGLLLPDKFLPIIEGNPLELELGLWVAQTAIKQLMLWNAAGLQLQVGINISPKHLQSDYFVSEVSGILQQYPTVNPRQLQIEILENSVLEDLEAVTAIILKCRDILGISVALDDFGTGYSSLTHLRRLPIQSIKIDKSFIRDMINDPGDCAIVQGVVGLAKAFDLQVIAEGVETYEHAKKLMHLDCLNAQGFGIAKPMPADQVYDWIHSRQDWRNWKK